MRIALVGNQNSGKTTLFNALTGSNQRVGNWAGVTLEKREGVIRNTNYEVIDLPGIYSLNTTTIEERITRDFLLTENVDLIINVIDINQIERSLFLTTQLLELSTPVKIVLNMADLIKDDKYKFNLEVLERTFGQKIHLVSSVKESGLDELINDLKNIERVNLDIYPISINNAIAQISKFIDHKESVFIALKLLEKDLEYEKYSNERIKRIVDILSSRHNISKEIAKSRYNFIETVIIEVEEKETITDKLDKIFLHKYLAIPIFILIMFFIYFLSTGYLGQMLVELVENLVVSFSELTKTFLTKLDVMPWLNSLITDGIIMGVGAVVSFTPQLFILFLSISILEQTGYMARIAFVLDKLFEKIGLSGKSIIPFIIGSGCTVPGILATKTIKSEEERTTTAILTSLVPCSAKLPIMTLFISHFFIKGSFMYSFSLYLLSVVLIVLVAYILSKTINKNRSSSFILELPTYKKPQYKYVSKDVYNKTSGFVKDAGTLIFASSIVVWFLASFSFKFKYEVDIEQTMLAGIGKVFGYIFYPMIGTNSWAAGVSILQGLVAKEQVVSSMAILAGLSSNETGTFIFNSPLFSFFTPASAYAFVAFNLFSAPCIASISTLRKEIGRKKAGIAIFLQTIFAYLLSILIFIIGRAIGG